MKYIIILFLLISNLSCAQPKLKYGKKLNEKIDKVYTNKKIILNNDSLNPINLTARYPLTINKQSKYFFSGDNVNHIKKFKIDKAGVPTRNEGSYFPTDVAQVGNKAFVNYKKTSSKEAKEIFLNQAVWAKDNFYHNDYYGFWIFPDEKPLYKLDPIWTSVLGQGQMISLCIAAYEETNDKDYLEIIEKAIKGFLVPIQYGGFSRNWKEDEIWYEEYPTPRPSRVLNGIIYGIASVYQVYQVTGSEIALQVFNSGVETLKNHIADYDTTYTSRYSLAEWKNEVSKDNYHEGHVLQLLWLYKVTNIEIFYTYAKKFLENDRDDFRKYNPYFYLEPKIHDIKAKHSIDSIKKGPLNLYDEKWGHGSYWSSHKDSELIVDFGKNIKDISGLTLFHVTKRSEEIPFRIFSYKKKSKEWVLVQNFNSKYVKDKISVLHKTGKYKTYINHYKIFEDLKGRRVKIVFDSSKENVIALREINFVFDRTKDLEYLLSKIEKQIEFSNKQNKINNFKN